MRTKTKLVYTVGSNDANYKVRTKVLIDGEIKSVLCPYYYRWTNMLKRCYGNKGKPLYDSYEGCSVHPDWHSFSNFKAWMEKQDWKGKALDKDLRVHGNKVYSEDTCCFVDGYINILSTVGGNRKQGTDLPLGVTKAVRGNNTYYMATMGKNDGSGGASYLAYGKTPKEAHNIWQKSKYYYIKEILPSYSGYEKICLERLLNTLTYDIENNLETKHL